MAGPYLKSGESIILTTDRVLIDDIEYDMILTSQRLALVDSDHTSDQPQVVPFATILSVKGGTTPAREPFITLKVIDPVGLEDSKTIDLIFSEQPYEGPGRRMRSLGTETDREYRVGPPGTCGVRKTTGPVKTPGHASHDPPLCCSRCATAPFAGSTRRAVGHPESCSLRCR